ncbi:LCP family protein [Ectobacillus funiculus]|uniref:LCP family protein n=1 Tax=Ectobacillus funiculus TaxID=137993 RepID=UPI00397964BF
MGERRQERKQRARIKWKNSIYILLVLLVVGGGLGIYAYQNFLPKNYFKNVATAVRPTTASEVKPKSGVFNVLIMGTDQRPEDPAGHSDSMILIHMDIDKKQYNAVSIPRDSRVYLKGYGYTKLTSAQYIVQADNNSLDKGVKAAAQAVSDFTGVPINYYAETTYWGLRDIIDTLGGVDVDVPYNVEITHSWIPQNAGKVVKAGTQHLDGTMALEVARERHAIADGEFGRQQLQEKVLLGVAKSVLKPQNIIKLPQFVQELPKVITSTNMTQKDVLSLALALKDFKSKQLQYHQLPGEYKTAYDDILQNYNDEYIVDQDKIKQLVSQYFS